MGSPAPVQGTRADREVSANYKVEFDGGGDDVALVSGVSGIMQESRYAESRQGGSRDPDYSLVDNAYGEVTFTGTVTSQDNAFSRWMDATLDGADRGVRQRSVTVIPLNADGTERAFCWRLERCNPRSYTPGDFDATSQDALSFTFVVQPTKVKYIPTPGL